MATLKQRVHRMNSSGSYDVIHYETEAGLVLYTNNSQSTVSGALDKLFTDMSGKANSSHNHAGSAITSGTVAAARLGTMTGATSSAAGTSGAVPAPAKGAATRYLRSDGTWQVPPDTNTTYSNLDASSGGTDVSLVTTGNKYNWNKVYNIFASIGTAIPENADLDTYVTPGAYYSASSTRSKTLTNAPYTGSGFKLVVMLDYATTRIVQIAVNTGWFYSRSTSDTGANWTEWESHHRVATTSIAGFMSSNDKTKLDGIATGANKYTHPSYTAKSSGLYKVTVDAHGITIKCGTNSANFANLQASSYWDRRGNASLPYGFGVTGSSSEGLILYDNTNLLRKGNYITGVVFSLAL